MGDGIRLFLQANRLEDEADMRGVIANWEQLVGKAIASRTDKLWFQDGTFFVQITSPVWKNELSFSKLRLKQLINEQLKREVVKEIRIV